MSGRGQHVGRMRELAPSARAGVPTVEIYIGAIVGILPASGGNVPRLDGLFNLVDQQGGKEQDESRRSGSNKVQ